MSDLVQLNGGERMIPATLTGGPLHAVRDVKVPALAEGRGPAWLRHRNSQGGLDFYAIKGGTKATYRYVSTTALDEVTRDAVEIAISDALVVPRHPRTQAQAARLMVAVLAGNAPDEHLIEVRFRDRRRRDDMGRAWFPVRDCQAAAGFALRKGRAGDVFISALPRVRESGGRRDVVESWVLWVDIDHEDALERMRAFPHAPSILLETGTPGHVLAVWQLGEPLEASRVKAANRRLALALGGDFAATDAARVIRVPGTFNHKQEPAASVICVAVEPTTFIAQELVGDLPDLPEPIHPARPTYRSDPDDYLGTIAAVEYVPLLTGRDLGSDGKVRCPFHGDGQERTPSLHCYDDPRAGWYCYGCEAGGSIYDLGARLYGIEPRGAGFRALRQRIAQELLARVEDAA